MNALFIYPQFPDTYWSFKHALSFLGKRAAQPPLGLMTVAALVPRSWNKRLVDDNVERLRDRDLAWADVAFISAMHIQKDALFAILARCRALGLRTVVGGPIASSLSRGRDQCRPRGDRRGREPDRPTRPRPGARHRQARLPGRRTPGDGDQPPARPEPHQDAPLLHHGRAVLARLSLQLRVLRHHRDLRPPSAHQGCRAGAGRTRPAARRRLAREPSSSSTTTSSATRRAPKNYAPRWPSGAVNTRPASTSIPKPHSTLPTTPS